MLRFCWLRKLRNKTTGSFQVLLHPSLPEGALSETGIERRFSFAEPEYETVIHCSVPG